MTLITIGRTVHYTLTAEQAQEINRRRTDSPSIAARIVEDRWPRGAQAHIGNRATKGDVLPLLVVKVWSPGTQVNGQVFLDGNDVLWVSSALEGTEPGQWHWPPRV